MTPFSLLDSILFGYFTLCIGYLLLFTVAAKLPQRNKKKDLAQPTTWNRFAILVPAYKEDLVILESTESILHQHYPQQLFELFVVADQMREATIQQLKARGVQVSLPHPGASSKANALKSVAASLPDNYDYVVILDADNVVPPTYLTDINSYLNQTSCIALQTHRVAKNLTTPTAVLDGAIEEMNNTIFRLGHIRLGLSSALIGSGMVFNYQWFISNVQQLHTTGEDKELEELLLRQGVSIHYAADICFKDEKVEQTENLSNQRRRWLATQFMLAEMMWKELPKAILKGNRDYLVKAFQSILLPRSILLASLGAATLLTLLITPTLSIKWGVLLIVLISTLYHAIPQNMKSPLFYKALRGVPTFMGMMLLNLFRLKGASRKFIHTKHG